MIVNHFNRCYRLCCIKTLHILRSDDESRATFLPECKTIPLSVSLISSLLSMVVIVIIVQVWKVSVKEADIE